MKKKILFYIPTLSGGGAERVLVNLINSLPRETYSSDICILKNVNILANELMPGTKVIPIFPDNFQWLLVRLTQKALKTNYFFSRSFFKKIKNDEYDIVVCFLDGEYTFLLNKLSNNTKKITWIHSSYKTNPTYKKIVKDVGHKKMMDTYNQIDKLVFVSNDVKEDFKEIFAIPEDKMTVIYNLILNEKLRKYISVQDKIFNDELSIVAVGRLVPVKGFDRLIRVLFKLKESGFRFKAQILGEGPERNNLEQLISGLSLSSCVKLAGFKSDPYETMSKSDILVLSSIAEGLPTVVCEGFFLSLPIVSTRCTGSSELLNEGEFGLIAEQSDESLYDCIHHLFENRTRLKHYSKQSASRARLFQKEAILAQLSSLFDSSELLL